MTLPADHRDPGLLAVNTPREQQRVRKKARQALVGLRSEAETLRTEVSNLQQLATQFRADASAAHLVEANEHLILAALHAETIAESAVGELDELTRSSQHDVLTGIPNRALMLDRLEHAIAIANRNHSRIAVLFVDIDNFKHINDTLGHAVGDDVVRLVARRLESVVRQSDTVSRHGGDEFLVLVSEIMQVSAAAVIAEKMLRALAEPHQAGEHELRLSASIGIAIYPDDGESASALIHRADTAMYFSKRRARGNFAYHSEQQAEDSASSARIHEQPSVAPVDHDALSRHAEAEDIQVVLRARIARELRSSFTPVQTIMDLLRQVRTEEPLMQILIERHLACLSMVSPVAVDTVRAAAQAVARNETSKTGEFVALDRDGTAHAVLEFTITKRPGVPDQTQRKLTQRSFGLTDGRRVYRLNATDFQVADTDLILKKCSSSRTVQSQRSGFPIS